MIQHDVFICHASEDKDAVARPLAEALREWHLDVWYDEFSMKVGDSLREAIDRGLASCRYGVVIVSPAFFQKRWTQREMNGLVAREMSEGRKLVLPIWHDVELSDVVAYSPPLADVVATRSSVGMDRMCADLLRTIRPEESPLMVARDELIRLGWSPPPISDEWWLDMVEAQEHAVSSMWSVPWRFPLPERLGSQGRRRGLNIAWTALQLDWQHQAEHRKICQITHPDDVLAFVRGDPALTEAAHDYPQHLANYAPQLLIPQFSAEFADDFDDLLRESEERWRTQPDRRFPEAMCDRQLALRHPEFGRHSAVEVAEKWMVGLGGDHSASVYEELEYIFWLLAPDSDWLPADIRAFLINGLKERATWDRDRIITTNGAFSSAMMTARRTPLRWTRGIKADLEEIVSSSIRKMGLTAATSSIIDRFIEEDFVGVCDRVERERAAARRR
ncbi:TIR domain-containing protein [Brevundimonas lenta]|uniref:TIR domain-containing protein n=1 Tax=Brevundimonas lenta TaxID=424796 RepID=A0A7W6NPU2_9CAUL|nr:TIR domain-containing protein [Brevundimonas lenta]MBB4083223.1 hypothetical protein [Brevundimonas lenta]